MLGLRTAAYVVLGVGIALTAPVSGTVIGIGAGFGGIGGLIGGIVKGDSGLDLIADVIDGAALGSLGAGVGAAVADIAGTTTGLAGYLSSGGANAALAGGQELEAEVENGDELSIGNIGAAAVIGFGSAAGGNAISNLGTPAGSGLTAGQAAGVFGPGSLSLGLLQTVMTGH